jgi:hypothetical protein
MKRSPIRPIARRSFVLSLLFLPVTCIGCGADFASASPKAGTKRRQRLEALAEKADAARKSKRAKAAPR